MRTKDKVVLAVLLAMALATVWIVVAGLMAGGSTTTYPPAPYPYWVHTLPRGG